ncbi:glycine betaine/L-proline ABC transporter ATP-binding protein ProV [Prosthecochloris sp. N3]|uniref:Glycine betaine/L-proline ABC transporter ATP-binding protein ProV n=1 Tax=Prosthecochloris ethylica TaxID=2743976 RepID=A0ABR9XST4_9CHLB|nr:glycine betaine/L-proline ABC transporter ATP-binding protein ProV [Prosthecochloris ethylica]MBF0585941.1 glycine betaine/L-proline ABC transporter ATP-binding protein ProV [Prosthecochloris ethylica]MBF0637054.1 glycine betaine/L-proline ABC transporter ATP-binding protein ProV [Prosthecochloris ethylica]NUK47291.1 glycine betaine/L-proline ABC transporter ATP-binding protein ProV [Prosthecochloris ethylica]
MSILEVRNLYKVFGPSPSRAFTLLEKGASKEEILKKTGNTVGINNASFSVEKQETFVIMGLSGSGKSTVIRCLNRLIEPTRGQVLIDGEDIMKMSKAQLLETRRKKLSMVFQQFALLPHRTVLGNAEYGLELSGVPKEERQQKAMQALEQVGLKGYEQQYPSELSGGMQQRVGLARALANGPEILLMDEAFSALDPLIRTQMQDELLELQATLQKTIIFITHDLDEALKIGDRIAIMKDGEVVQIGTPEQILTKPADEYVRAFVQNVDRTKVITVSAIMRKAPTVALYKEGPKAAIRKMENERMSIIYALDNERKLQGIVTIDDAIQLVRERKDDLTPVVANNIFTTTPDTAIGNLLGTALETSQPIAVLDENGRLAGIVDRASILGELSKTMDEEELPVSLADQLEEESTPNQKED